MALSAAWLYEFSLTQLALALCGSLVIASLVGVSRIRAVAMSLQNQRAADFERIAEAVGAAEQTVVWTATQLCQGSRPPLPPEPQPAGEDPLEKVIEVIGHLQVQSAGSLLRTHDESQAAVLVAMHRTLTRRQHVLIDEMLDHLTRLQMATEDAELLDRSFKIDHLATRLRRMVESVSVVLGGQSLRETRAPVQVATVLRGAKSEVVKYKRVQTVPGDVGSKFALPAHVHPDIAHLLAELIDNGLEHSDPVTKVTVSAQKVAHGLLIEVEDRATLLMDPDKRRLLNHLLANPAQADVAGQVRAGNLGLITTAKIAAKYGLKVWLTMNSMGGTTANVVVPNQYLVPTTPTIGTVTVSAALAAPQLAFAGAAQQPARPATSTARPAEQADSGSASPLPRRRRVARPMPDQAGGEPAAPAPAANPQALADWRAGLRAGMSTDPTPDRPAFPRPCPRYPAGKQPTMTHDVNTAPMISPEEVKEEMTRLIDEFVEDTPGVTHALLASRDGMKQVVPSHMNSTKADQDWTDELAAAASGLAALAKGITGPTGDKRPVQQILIGRDDALFLLTEAGVGSAFTESGKSVATVLMVLTRTDANVGTVAFSVGRLVQRFAPFMTTPVRAHGGQGDGVA
ncbi:roadblock/LC7 domain-containing protein [Streptomyces broussonetiae]|uniref:histidine kinase n=1 Tax=Streptomyces broussonetiae TaxID=2686304 RepID=A0ABV5EG26_9ACTN